MPIYEYYCADCNTVYQFLVKRMGEDPHPACPKCGREELKKVMSRFSTRSRSSLDLGNLEDDPDLSGIDENDPKSMARAIRHMADEMGEDLGPELNEAISRLEAGEDPEKIERELEEMGLDDGMGGPGGMGEPSYDPGIYDA